MSSLDHQVNYKGEHVPYAPRRCLDYHVRSRMDRIQRELKAFILPFVEVGFDAQQIQAELHMQGQHLVPTGQIESIISIILGEQQ